ncbi:natural cytotoxicity triggering receptor 3 ligand 1 isoform X2 [Petaurus breviceps papuanus]|uniref:natural cytotoxicity triggering receptor 3 ligand 1 isoform X2 n=1 Tax=Petaurus breviceps papuanus TaxID=3040969 RepID=UPI0036D95727
MHRRLEHRAFKNHLRIVSPKPFHFFFFNTCWYIRKRHRTSSLAGITLMALLGHFPAVTALFLGELLGLCAAHYVSGSLEVRMDEKAQTVSLNANITIHCVLSDYGSLPLNISVIGVRWFLRTSNSAKEDIVFLYNGGKWTQFRPGANIEISGLRRGDASLHLPHIQLQEGGEYRCEVIIPPNRVQRTARLDLVAQPSNILLPPETVVKEKKAYTLKCTVTEFYPEPVYITWKKVLPGMQSLNVETFEGNSTNSIRNSDGTFNATSSFVLHPILEDNGTIYQCVVAHKSLLIPLQSSTILIVTAAVTAAMEHSSPPSSGKEDSLEVKMDGKVQTVSLNANVTISCMLSGYGSPPLNITDIDIRWSLRRSNSDKQEKVFEFSRGRPIQYRPEANISMSRLMEGDASLYLSHIQLQEGGEYTCEVTISSRRAQGTIRLDVVEPRSHYSFYMIFITLLIIVGIIWCLCFRRARTLTICGSV